MICCTVRCPWCLVSTIEETSRVFETTYITLSILNNSEFQSNSNHQHSVFIIDIQDIMLSPVNLLSVIIFYLLIASMEAFQRPALSSSAPRSLRASALTMVSGNKANFGLFSPAVVAAKFVLGEAKLNKVEEDRFLSCSFPRTYSNASLVILLAI